MKHLCLPPLLTTFALCLVGVSCQDGNNAVDASTDNQLGSSGGITAGTSAGGTIVLGGPIPGLTPSELDAFDRGRTLFEKRFKPSEGLGPFYNATSCRSCHSTPTTGGSSQLYRNFYLVRIGRPGSQINLPGLPGPIMPFYGTGLHHSADFELEGGRPVIPDQFLTFPINVAQRNAVPTFGVGLFEFVSDATIMSNTDPNDMNGDGISGRFNTDQGTIGRFGVKAQSNSIELFTRAPLQNQLGITTDPFLGSAGTVSLSHAALLQVSTNPNDPTIDDDGVPDPELAHSELGDLIAFQRFLAPPVPQPFSPQAANGELLFDSTGCTMCHLPSLPSSRGPVGAYTDLLLHDMGAALADGLSFGIPQASTISPDNTVQEFRTQPLWGVSMSAPYLHDGQAETLEEAILLHGGEAQAIRDAFAALSMSDQGDIITFLEHL